MVYAILTAELALLSLHLGGSKLIFLRRSLCDFLLLCKGPDPGLFHDKIYAS